MDIERHFVGEELKLAVSIDCIGFDIDTDPWTATVCCGRKAVTYSRESGAQKYGTGWVLPIDTTQLGAGCYKLITEYDVPDSDFKDGMRRVVKEQIITNVEPTWR